MNSRQAINLLKGLEQSLDDYCGLNDEGKAAFRMAITALELFGNTEQLPTIEPEPQWIPCSERLPKQGQEVICQCRASIIKVLKLDADGDWYQDADHCYMGGFVIVWMPLPEPYKEKNDE